MLTPKEFMVKHFPNVTPQQIELVEGYFEDTTNILLVRMQKLKEEEHRIQERSVATIKESERLIKDILKLLRGK